jgi:hypothetical protein
VVSAACMYTYIYIHAHGRVATGVEVVRGSPTCDLCLIHCGLCRMGGQQQADAKMNVKAKRELLVSAGVVGLCV